MSRRGSEVWRFVGDPGLLARDNIHVLLLTDNKEVRYQVVSGFVFLRFFAPAILGPRLFKLRSDMPVRLICMGTFGRFGVMDMKYSEPCLF